MTPFQAPDAAVQPARAPAPARSRPWHTVVWNDPVNLMSYVTYVFRTYFGMSEDVARAHMLRVHHEGHAVVSHGSREKMEVDVYALQSYGLWATLEPGDGNGGGSGDGSGPGGDG